MLITFGKRETQNHFCGSLQSGYNGRTENCARFLPLNFILFVASEAFE